MISLALGHAIPLPNPKFIASRLKHCAKDFLCQSLDLLRVSEREIDRCRRDRILMYHSCEKGRSNYSYSVSRRNLEEHLRFLKRHFKIVSLDDMFNQSAAESRVALTFDDAYDDVYFNAYPLLQRYQTPATVFVPTRYIDQPNDIMHDKLLGCAKRHLTWEQIREMQASGLIAFESHTHTHYNAVERIDILRQELLTSIEVLRRNIGYRPKYFAYPYGACNAQTHAIVLDCGFEKLLTTESRAIVGHATEGRFDINRHNEHLPRFKMTVAEINIRSWFDRPWPTWQPATSSRPAPSDLSAR